MICNDKAVLRTDLVRHRGFSNSSTSTAAPIAAISARSSNWSASKRKSPLAKGPKQRQRQDRSYHQQDRHEVAIGQAKAMTGDELNDRLTRVRLMMATAREKSTSAHLVGRHVPAGGDAQRWGAVRTVPAA
jgi:hypothetical protein